MPLLKINSHLERIPWTKIPNSLLDEHMPRLKDTELRLLLLILRMTIGMPLERDTVYLSYPRLMHLTGRGSEAVSNGLKGLEAKGLILKATHLSTEKSPRW